jgi:transcription factor E
MLDKFLKEVVSSVVGKSAEEAVDMLSEKKHVNEFAIAKKLNLTINQTRNILYRLADHGLVSSVRKKDRKKGWYTYFWKIEILKSLEYLKDIKLKRSEQFKNQIKSRESKQFYVCDRCNIEFSEENALLHNFTCGECGNIFSMKDNSKVIKEMEKNLVRINGEVELIDVEILKEKQKLDKDKEKEAKKLKKEKDAERVERAIKLKKERAKLEKANPKSKKEDIKKSKGKKLAKKPKKKK